MHFELRGNELKFYERTAFVIDGCHKLESGQ